jgi:uncharacterized YccA/Bax inhibitor family protein
MTLQGTVNKAGFLILLAIASGAFTWNLFRTAGDAAMPWTLLGLAGGFVLALITIFRPQSSPYTAPMYAVCEGLFLGTISAISAKAYPGIAFQAMFLTFGTLAGMLMAYKTGMIRATEKFKLMVISATAGIALLYLATIILSCFNIQMAYLHDSSPIGIGISVVIVAVAAMNLVLDFSFIEEGIEYGAPKYMEWYGGFSLLVTLVWLYLEILRLLRKLRR